MSDNYTGYGVLVGGELVYTRCDQCEQDPQLNSRSLCELVLEKDHPDGRLVFWAQGIDTPTVFEVIK